MMMAAAIVLMLVTRDAVVERDLAGESAFCQQLQRAIHRSKANARIAFAHELMKLFDGEVLVRFEECEEDGVTLLGPFQADAFEMLLKSILCFTQPFLRDRDWIINAFLQHLRAFLA